MSQPPSSGDGAGDISSELESFRQQWRAEVKAKAAPWRTSGAASSSASSKAPATATASTTTAAATTTTTASQAPQRPPGLRRGSSAAGGLQTPLKLLSSGKKPLAQENDDDYAQPRAFDDDVRTVAQPVNPAVATSDPSWAKASSAHQPQDAAKEEPKSALEHYEKGVEKEAMGSLGDSLKHYRTAFRMDSTVDKKYKKKHFPAPPPAAAGNTTGSSSTETGKKPEASTGTDAAAAPTKPVREGPPPTLKELIMSFAGLAIEGAPPPIEGMPPPPCPLAELPDELLVHILRDVAIDDVGDFVRLAQVCRKLAFLVATEDRIWRRVCVGHEFGFANMHRSWARAIEWGPITEDNDGSENQVVLTEDERRRKRQASSYATTMKLCKGIKAVEDPHGSVSTPALPPVYPSWQRMFRLRPRIRFNGCYISTVNYIRPGQPSASLVTWNNPVHIVTYFRYLRFFRDGTVISLLTTSEPPDVIHHLTKDLVTMHQGGAMAHLPSIVMQNALRGRWRMSGIQDETEDSGIGGSADSDNELRNRDDAGLALAAAAGRNSTILPPTREGKEGKDTGTADEGTPVSPFSSLAAATEAESDVVVETEGVLKYYYRMELTFRSAGKGTRNNKLNWRGFYSYDQQTDDWGEFGLRNYRPFFFSRVRSYGVGE
ncbi:hypothetical protein SEUCBS140593_008015 [Sporothrix eucalyptigena]|uniref:F-box domain-containing protein n=1 Tax=Sporothrix eucalyptigena TaxID=1812306 RepID=A0ABP0CJB8_9PEZI